MGRAMEVEGLYAEDRSNAHPMRFLNTFMLQKTEGAAERGAPGLSTILDIFTTATAVDEQLLPLLL